MAELQFSGSRRDLAAEKGVGVCASAMERQGEGKKLESAREGRSSHCL